MCVRSRALVNGSSIDMLLSGFRRVLRSSSLSRLLDFLVILRLTFQFLIGNCDWRVLENFDGSSFGSQSAGV